MATNKITIAFAAIILLLSTGCDKTSNISQNSEQPVERTKTTTVKIGCNTPWSNNCSEDKTFCAPENYQLCGFKATISSEVNGSYGADSIRNNCVRVNAKSNGSGNPFDQIGGSIWVNLELFSFNKNITLNDEEKKNFCVIHRDRNPDTWHCNCVAGAMVCESQTGKREVIGVCYTAPTG